MISRWNHDLARKLKPSRQAIEARADLFREIRHRALAHNDLPTSLNYHPEPLLGVSRQQVEEMLQSIRDFMTAIGIGA